MCQMDLSDNLNFVVNLVNVVSHCIASNISIKLINKILYAVCDNDNPQNLLWLCTSSTFCAVYDKSGSSSGSGSSGSGSVSGNSGSGSGSGSSGNNNNTHPHIVIMYLIIQLLMNY